MPPEEKGKVLLFNAGEALFGVQLMKILRVVAEDNLTFIPRTPDQVKGAIFHEGVAVPVFFCEGCKDAKDRDNLVLLLDHPNGPIGLAIDKVIGVVDEAEVTQDEDGTLKFGGEGIKMISSESLVSPSTPDKM